MVQINSNSNSAEITQPLILATALITELRHPVLNNILLKILLIDFGA